MMDKCQEELIDLILVKQMSRFGGNTINTLQAIYELRNLGVELYFETDELYASNSNLDFITITSNSKRTRNCEIIRYLVICC